MGLLTPDELSGLGNTDDMSELDSIAAAIECADWEWLDEPRNGAAVSLRDCRRRFAALKAENERLKAEARPVTQSICADCGYQIVHRD